MAADASAPARASGKRTVKPRRGVNARYNKRRVTWEEYVANRDAIRDIEAFVDAEGRDAKVKEVRKKTHDRPRPRHTELFGQGALGRQTVMLREPGRDHLLSQCTGNVGRVHRAALDVPVARPRPVMRRLSAFQSPLRDQYRLYQCIANGTNLVALRLVIGQGNGGEIRQDRPYYTVTTELVYIWHSPAVCFGSSLI